MLYADGCSGRANLPEPSIKRGLPDLVEHPRFSTEAKVEEVERMPANGTPRKVIHCQLEAVGVREQQVRRAARRSPKPKA